MSDVNDSPKSEPTPKAAVAKKVDDSKKVTATKEVVGKSKTKEAPKSKLKYRLLTGKDDHNFCERVSQAIEDGYHLYGSPAITYNAELKCNIVAQAVILKGKKKK